MKKQMKKLTRREFIKLSGTAAAAGLLTGCCPPSPQATESPTPQPTSQPTPQPTSQPTDAPKPITTGHKPEVIKFHPDAPSKVVQAHHAGVWTSAPTEGSLADSAEENGLLAPEALREMLDASIMGLTGLDKSRDAWTALFSPEERIAIKVNVFRNSLIWTHVPLVTAVTDSLQDAGILAEQIVIFDYYTSELEKAGFAINEDGPGVRCYGTDSNYTQGGTVMEMDIALSNILLECDALINMPVLKSHMLAGLSFAMKNHYGSISMPSLLHRDIEATTAELNALSPIRDRTRLIIGDVLTACLRYRGSFPYWSSDWTGDSVLVSFDPVAIDATALQMLGQFLTDEGGNPASILMMATPYLENAAELGLGTNDPANMDLTEITLG